MNPVDIAVLGVVAHAPQIRGSDLLAAVINGAPAVEYQPIKDVHSLETIAHEALARFSANGRALPPDRVFAKLHDNPLLLHYAELKWKRAQIELAPPGGRLFINLDPDAWEHGWRCDSQDSYIEMIAPLADRVVIEIIENLNLRDVEDAEALSNACRRAGIPVALDDVSSSRGLVSFAALSEAHFMKFERGWLFYAETDEEREVRLALIEYALTLSRRFKLTTVLEGVETEEHLALARHYGFDCVQGFLFRDEFVQRTGDRRQPAACPWPIGSCADVDMHQARL